MSLWIASWFWSRTFSFRFRTIRSRRCCRPSLAIVWISHSHLLAAAAHCTSSTAVHWGWEQQQCESSFLQLIRRALLQEEPGRSWQQENHLAAPLECCFPGSNLTIPDHSIPYHTIPYLTIPFFARPHEHQTIACSNTRPMIWYTNGTPYLAIASCYTIPYITGYNTAPYDTKLLQDKPHHVFMAHTILSQTKLQTNVWMLKCSWDKNKQPNVGLYPHP